MRAIFLTTVSRTLSAFLIPFAAHLRSLGWTVDAGAAGITHDAVLKEEFDNLHEIPWSRSLLSFQNFTQACRVLRKIVFQNNYDFVHVHTPIAAFLARYALRNLRPAVKVIYTAHGFHFGYSSKSPCLSPFFYFERFAGRWTDALIVINQDDLATAKRYHLVPSGRLYHTPGIGIDLSRYNRAHISLAQVQSIHAELGLNEGDFLLLMIAEFNLGKRHLDLLRAFAILQNPKLHIAFAGDGLHFEDIKKRAILLSGSANLHFLGFRRDIPALIAAADATILPSEREGLPRSIMESMALETPVLGSRIRGISELLSDNCGLLFDLGDSQQIAHQVLKLIGDPNLRRKLAVNARQKIERYSLASVLAVHDKIYQSVLGMPADNIPS